METQIELDKQNEQQLFADLIKALVNKFSPERIYCFGTNSAIVDKNTCFIEPYVETKTNYFLLMIMESKTQIEHEVQEYTNNILTAGNVTVLVHEKSAIAKALKENNRFFNTVYREAAIVYSRDGLFSREEVPLLIIAQSVVKAKKKFFECIQLADGFYAGADECFSTDRPSACVLLLHLTVEQCCNALIHVYLDYQSEIHNLKRLLHLCRCFSDEPANLLLQTGSYEDKELLDLLVKSYSMARYKHNFDASYEDADRLLKCVGKFIELTSEMYDDKIKKFEKEVYKETKKTNVLEPL